MVSWPVCSLICTGSLEMTGVCTYYGVCAILRTNRLLLKSNYFNIDKIYFFLPDFQMLPDGF